MSTDPDFRPDLDDILSYLNYNPLFLTPCLDAPTTSIVHEETQSMEIPHMCFSHIEEKELDLNTPLFSKLNKKKTLSGILLSKSGRSSSTQRSLKSSRSSSVCTENFNNTNLPGLTMLPLAETFDIRLSLERRSRLKNYDSEIMLNHSLCDHGISVCDRDQLQQSLPILNQRSQKNKNCYLSQESKICETVTSL